MIDLTVTKAPGRRYEHVGIGVARGLVQPVLTSVTIRPRSHPQINLRRWRFGNWCFVHGMSWRIVIPAYWHLQ